MTVSLLLLSITAALASSLACWDAGSPTIYEITTSTDGRAVCRPIKNIPDERNAAAFCRAFTSRIIDVDETSNGVPFRGNVVHTDFLHVPYGTLIIVQ